MENILLFSVEMDPREILSPLPNLELQVFGYDNLTTKEVKKFNDLIGEAAQIVVRALIRGMQENEGEE